MRDGWNRGMDKTQRTNEILRDNLGSGTRHSTANSRDALLHHVALCKHGEWKSNVERIRRPCQCQQKSPQREPAHFESSATRKSPNNCNQINLHEIFENRVSKEMASCFFRLPSVSLPPPSPLFPVHRHGTLASGFSS